MSNLSWGGWAGVGAIAAVLALLVAIWQLSMFQPQAGSVSEGPPTVVAAPTAAPPAAAPTTEPTVTTGGAVPPSSPAPLYLADTDPVETDQVRFGNSPSVVNGTSCVRPINVARYGSRRATLGYDLGRQYAVFETQVGLQDDSEPEARQRFEVLGDGWSLAQVEVSLGELQPIKVSVEGVLRLQLVLSTLTEDGHQAVATWCDPRAIQ